MTEAAAILELRHVRLADHATMRPAALGATEGVEGVFVAIDDPPPVRTVLAVVEGERRRALEVVWVVEVAEHGETRGFYGRWVDDEVLERAANVGTEALEDGMPVVQPVVSENSAGIDVSDGMAMPAPVMIMDDDTGVIDEGEAEADEREAEPAAERAAERVREEPDDEDEVYGLVAREPPSPADDALPEAAPDGEASEASPPEAGDTSGEAADGPAKSRKKRGRKRR